MTTKLISALLIGVPWLALILLFVNKKAIAKFLESVGASKILDQVKSKLTTDVVEIDKEIEKSKEREEKIKDSDVDLNYHNRRDPNAN